MSSNVKHRQKKAHGRPTVMTDDILSKLEQAFLMGYSDTEACYRAGICKATLCNYQRRNPRFLERKEQLKRRLISASRDAVGRAILTGDLNTAKWYLERKAKDEFSLKTEQQITEREPPKIVDDVSGSVEPPDGDAADDGGEA